MEVFAEQTPADTRAGADVAREQPFPLFEQAFGRLTGEGGKFGGMMDKLSTTTGGILSTLKGEFDGFLRTVGEAFLPIIKDLALGAMPLLNVAMELLKPILNTISLAFQALKNFITPLIPPLSAIWDAFGRIKQAMAPLVDAIFPGLNNQFGILDLVVKPIAFILEGVATVLGYLADAIVFVIDAWDRFAANSPKIAAAIEYIVFPLKAAVTAVEKFGDAWDYVFGDGGDSVGGLAQKSQSYISEMAKVAGKEFGATSQQVIAFSKTLKAAEFAGKSQGDALILLKEKFAAFMAAEKAADKAGKNMNTTINGTKKEAEPAAGSIDYLTAKIKKLKDEYTSTTDAMRRLQIKEEIREFEEAVSSLENAGGLANKVVGGVLATGMTRAANAVDNQNKKLERLHKNLAILGNMKIFTSPAQNALTIWDKLSTKIGEDATGKIKEGIDQLKASFRDFGVQAVQSIGYAIGSGKSAADAFKNVVAAMMVEVPKLAGMALLNAGVAAGPTPAGLALALAGLALIGLSGLVGGIQSKNQAERDALQSEMQDLPTGATGAGGGASMGGLGGFTAGNQVQPIQVNVNAEMDGVQLGGLFKRVTNNYNKTVVKQF